MIHIRVPRKGQACGDKERPHDNRKRGSSLLFITFNSQDIGHLMSANADHPDPGQETERSTITSRVCSKPRRG